MKSNSKKSSSKFQSTFKNIELYINALVCIHLNRSESITHALS